MNFSSTCNPLLLSGMQLGWIKISMHIPVNLFSVWKEYQWKEDFVVLALGMAKQLNFEAEVDQEDATSSVSGNFIELAIVSFTFHWIHHPRLIAYPFIGYTLHKRIHSMACSHVGYHDRMTLGLTRAQTTGSFFKFDTQLMNNSVRFGCSSTAHISNINKNLFPLCTECQRSKTKTIYNFKNLKKC